MWRARFGRGFGPVVRRTIKWMNVLCICFVWVINCTRCTVRIWKKYPTVYSFVVREKTHRASPKIDTVLYMLVTDRSAFIHTFFALPVRQITLWITPHSPVLHYVVSLHPTLHYTATHTTLYHYCGLPSNLNVTTHIVTWIGSAFRRTFWTIRRSFEILNLGKNREYRAGIAKIIPKISLICDNSVTTRNLWFFRRNV